MFGKKLLSTDEMILGEGKRTAKVAKLTPAKFRELNKVTESIPVLVLHVFEAFRSDDWKLYIIQLIEEMLDEVIAIVAVLSEIDKEYLENEVGIDELANYLIAVIKKNDFNSAIKNGKSLLSAKA